jgi:hypothetical protein
MCANEKEDQETKEILDQFEDQVDDSTLTLWRASEINDQVDDLTLAVWEASEDQPFLLPEIEECIDEEILRFWEAHDTHTLNTVVSSGNVGVERLALIIAQENGYKTFGACASYIPPVVRKKFNLIHLPFCSREDIVRLNIDYADVVIGFVHASNIHDLHYVGYCVTGVWSPLSKQGILYQPDRYYPFGEEKYYRSIFLIHPERLNEPVCTPCPDFTRSVMTHTELCWYLTAHNAQSVFITGHTGEGAWIPAIQSFLFDLL